MTNELDYYEFHNPHVLNRDDSGMEIVLGPDGTPQNFEYDEWDVDLVVRVTKKPKSPAVGSKWRWKNSSFILTVVGIVEYENRTLVVCQRYADYYTNELEDFLSHHTERVS